MFFDKGSKTTILQICAVHIVYSLLLQTDEEFDKQCRARSAGFLLKPADLVLSCLAMITV